MNVYVRNTNQYPHYWRYEGEEWVGWFISKCPIPFDFVIQKFHEISIATESSLENLIVELEDGTEVPASLFV